MTDRRYCYPPDFVVLRNKLGLRDAVFLNRAERLLVTQRMREPIPLGRFDLAHLCTIHRHLFQDIYDWAGDLRTVEIAKGGTQFQPVRYLETGIADVHRRLREAHFLKGLSSVGFAEAAGRIIGDINHAHPFREGNGRTQLVYLKQLSDHAGHELVLVRISAAHWIDASRRAHLGDYTAMAAAIRRALKE